MDSGISAPATYSRLVNLVLQGLSPSIALPFLDDTAVFSATVDDHVEDLEAVLRAFQAAGLKLNPKKCGFFRGKIRWLGHEVSSEGISPIPEYTRVVKEWPLPRTRQQVRMFLGKVGYYSRFIKDYSKLSADWSDVCGKGTPEQEKEEVVVTKAMEESFAALKRALTSAPVLAFPDFQSPRPMILDTDWSHDARSIGAVLSQEQPDGTERPIAYAAKKLAKEQRNYCATKGELYAALYFMKFFRYYLFGRRFVLRSDHSALKSLANMSPPIKLEERWLGALADYDFEVRHRKGTQHQNADALSRCDHAQPIEENPEEADEGQPNPERHRVTALIPAQIGFSRQDLIQSQQNDRDLDKLRKHMDGTEATARELKEWSANEKYFYHLRTRVAKGDDGLLWYRRPTHVPGTGETPVVLLPRDLVEQAIRHAHVMSGHGGARSTTHRALLSFQCPGLLRQVRRSIRGCETCQLKITQGPRKHSGTIQALPKGSRPGQIVSMDFVGPLHAAATGETYILTARCSFSRYVAAWAVHRPDAATVVKGIIDMNPLFEPQIIHTDNGKAFVSRDVRKCCEAYGIQLEHGIAWNPRSCPVERSHRDLNAILRSFVLNNPPGWAEALPHAIAAMNQRICRMTGVSPFFAMKGRDPVVELRHIFGPPPEALEQPLTSTQQQLESVRRWAQDNFGVSFQRLRCQPDPVRRLDEGQKVWLFTPGADPAVGKKFTCHYSGPWTIRDKISEVLFRIKPHPEWEHLQPLVVGLDRLVEYKNPQPGYEVVEPGPGDLRRDHDPFVEAYEDAWQPPPGAGEDPEEPGNAHQERGHPPEAPPGSTGDPEGPRQGQKRGRDPSPTPGPSGKRAKARGLKRARSDSEDSDGPEQEPDISARGRPRKKIIPSPWYDDEDLDLDAPAETTPAPTPHDEGSPKDQQIAPGGESSSTPTEADSGVLLDRDGDAPMEEPDQEPEAPN